MEGIYSLIEEELDFMATRILEDESCEEKFSIDINVLKENNGFVYLKEDE